MNMNYICLLLLLVGDAHAHVSKLFPLPNHLTSGTDDALLVLPNDFKITALQDTRSQFLQIAIDRYMQNKFLFPNTPARDVATQMIDTAGKKLLHELKITVSDLSGDLNPSTDESYNLTVDSDAEATLSAATVFGALRGMETFSQLLDFAGYAKMDSQAIFEVSSLPVTIMDSPRFSYRGLMIDTSRHFLPVDLIVDNLDVMAFNKLNVLHWHIVDSQSFPFQSEIFPELSGKGAYQSDHIYSIADVQKVISEAYLRGIRVIPEFDTPGHTQSWGSGMPDILSHCPHPSEPLDPSNPLTFEVLTKLYKEISGVFKDEYIHLGGDEVGFGCWKQDPRIGQFMKEQNLTSYESVEQYFETKLLQIVGERLNKKTIVWQEIFNNGLKVRPDTVVDVWKGFDTKTILQATSAGLQVVISGCWYLDHLNDDWDRFYGFDITEFAGSDAQKALVIGGHSSMWGEHVDAANFMSRVWPRASSVAEKLWLSQSLTAAEAKPRLADFRCRLVARGVAADPLGPGYCPVELTYQSMMSDKSSSVY